MVEAAGIVLSSRFTRCRDADSFSFRFSPSFRFLENMDPPCFHCCDYTVVFSIFGGGGGNRTRVRRYCHLNIYKLIPYFKSYFLTRMDTIKKASPHKISSGITADKSHQSILLTGACRKAQETFRRRSSLN